MRIPSGKTDQVLYFVAIDSTNYTSMKTGLSSSTVYRARNGAAAAAYTTPTIVEVSSANMPGIYSLLLDEDMSVASGNDSEEVVLRITATGMVPVTRVFELYREKITQGQTLAVATGRAQADVKYWDGTAVAAQDTAGYPKVTVKNGTGNGELSLTSGRINADVVRWNGTAVAVPSVAGVPKVETVSLSGSAGSDAASSILDTADGLETGYTVRAGLS